MKQQRGLSSQSVLAAAMIILLAGSWSVSDANVVENCALAADDERIDPATLRIPPREPPEAVKSFKTVDGFRLDLLAAEPLVTDPVAMEYDENGRAYVAEMRDYPYTDRTNDKPMTERTNDLPLGRIRLLEDTDGDGRFDRSTVFADGLSWPTGLALWKGGVYVAATPDLWYLKDTDGNRRADIRRKVFTGFFKFNVQAVINNLRWGLDHRVYGAGGSNGGLIRRVGDAGGSGLKMTANDFRFDPLEEQLELISGGARFGHSFDDWGGRFICNIRNPIRHAVIEDRYLTRNPLLPIASPLHDVAEAGDTLPIYRISQPEPWRVINARRLASDPTLASPRSETVAAGYVTAACGLTIYRGSAYPPAYFGQAFLGEVAANVIHRQILSPDGMTFRAVRLDRGVEFVASTDNWFRPVNFTNAPDGTLHVLDMYRETIEHPWSIPDDIKKALDLESGRDRGRIYRLTPPGFALTKTPRLGSASVGELVAALENPNAWWRETASRLIYERQDRSCIDLLRALLRKRTSNPPTGPPIASLARLHALWSLHGQSALCEDDLLIGLADPTAGVREHAVRLAEPRLASSSTLRKRVLELASDQDLRVRGQVALSLAELDDDQATVALAAIARRDPAEPWIRLAVLSARPERAVELLESLGRGGDVPLLTLRALAAVVGARGRDEELRRALRTAASIGSSESGAVKRFRRELVVGLSDGLSRRNVALSQIALTVEPHSLSWMSDLGREAAVLASDSGADASERVQAVMLIGLGPFERARDALTALLGPQHPQEVQLAAVQAIARHASREVPGVFLSAYRRATPAARAEMIHHLVARKEWIGPLLDALGAGTVSIADVPLSRRTILLRNSDESIRSRSLALFVRERAGARGDVVKRYRPALTLAADSGRGRLVARRVCLNCHSAGGEGNDVGPALETIRHRTPEELLLHVLEPNREVSPNFFDHVVILKNGRVTAGVIAAETPTSITLNRAGGAKETILRGDIDELTSTGKSIMPEGLESQITLQEMADLLAFLLRRD
jgi:putative membrane-bound dehydrogenase-like protein